MDMADQKVTLHDVNSCNLGKIGSDGVALKLNFAMSADEMKTGPYKSAVFGLSHKSARGLAQALVRVLEETTDPNKEKHGRTED